MKETAKISGRNLPISTKQSVEICNFIRYKSTEKSKKLLENVIQMKSAVPFRRYNKDIGHRKGKMASGRFPIKASEFILNLVKGVEANAKNKGLNGELIIESIIANKGERNWRYGRLRRRKNKRTHIDIVVTEKKTEKKKTKEVKKK